MKYLELVVGRHHVVSKEKMIAFTKWCPAEDGIKTFEQAEKAVDLALSRMGQKKIDLMQCLSCISPSFSSDLSLVRSCLGLHG